MILVGSRAAALRGCLPDWRQGRTFDHDFHATAAEASDFLARLTAIDSRDGRHGVNVITPAGLVSIMDWDAVSDALSACPDTAPGVWLGASCAVIGEAAQLALKLAYARHARVHRDKSLADIAWWLPRVASARSFGPAHEAVFDRMRQRAARIFPGPGTSPFDEDHVVRALLAGETPDLTLKETDHAPDQG